MQDIRWRSYPRVAAQPVTRSYIEYLVLAGKKPRTIDAYARGVELLLAFFNNDHNLLADADEDIGLLFIANLKRQRPKSRGRGGLVADAELPKTNVRRLRKPRLADTTVAQRVVACREYYGYLQRRKIRSLPFNPIPRGNNGANGEEPRRGPVKVVASPPWVPNDRQWKALLTHVILHEDERTRALFLLTYEGALRREEAVSLRHDDVDWETSIVTIRGGITKNGRTRHVPISGATMQLLQTYVDGSRASLLEAYGGDSDGPLFVSESTRNPAQPLSPGSFNDIVARIRVKLSLPALTPHTLRHQRCTMLKRSGASMDDIALLAGHKRLETTARYVHLAPIELGKRLQEKVAPYDAPIADLVARTIGIASGHE